MGSTRREGRKILEWKKLFRSKEQLNNLICEDVYTHKSKPYYVHNFLAHQYTKQQSIATFWSRSSWFYICFHLKLDLFMYVTPIQKDIKAHANNFRKTSQERDNVHSKYNVFQNQNTKQLCSPNILENKNPPNLLSTADEN